MTSSWLGTMGLVVLFIGLITWRGSHLEHRRDLALDVQVDARITTQAQGCERHLGRSGRGQSGFVYLPRLQFQYAYQGQVHSSNLAFISPRSGFYTRQDCEHFMAKLVQTQQLKAWLDPSQPDLAVLDRSRPSLFLEKSVVTLGSALLLSFVIVNLKARRRASGT